MKKPPIGARGLILACIIAGLAGCGNLFSSHTEAKDSGDDIPYAQLRGLSYMGGSVYYDPQDPSGSAVVPGASIAVRLGHATASRIDARQVCYKDILAKALYGYVKIESVDASGVSLECVMLGPDGAARNRAALRVSLNGTADVDGDGTPDIGYAPPASPREGMESAVYLSFLSSQESLTTTMFSLMPKQYARGSYPNGVIGITPEGRFLVSRLDADGAARALPRSLAAGDYIVDNRAGTYLRVKPGRYARGVTDGDLEDVAGDAATAWLFSETSFQGGSSARALVSALPEFVKEAFSSPATEAEAVGDLNDLIEKRDMVREFAGHQAVPIPAEDIAQLLTDVEGYTREEVLELNRLFLQHLYPDLCPEVAAGGQGIASILPLASLVIGDPDADPGANSNSRALSSSAYDAERAAIESRYSSFSTIWSNPWSKVGDTGISLENSGIKIGLRGTFTITWSSVASTIEGAVLLQLDSNIVANASFTKDLVPPWNISQTTPVFAVGPIVFNVGGKASFTMPLTVSMAASQSFGSRLAFTGLYGAGVDIGAGWGINYRRWWFVSIPVPYFSPSGNGRLISATSYYIGTDAAAGMALNGASVSVNPCLSWGLLADISGVVHGSISAGIGLRPQLSFSCPAANLLVGTGQVDLTTNITASAGVGVTIPVINYKVGRDWDFPIVSSTSTLAKWELFRKKI